MRLKLILSKLFFWRRKKERYSSTSTMDCIVLAFWLSECNEPGFVQSLSKILSQLPLLYWNIFPPNWIICILQDTKENCEKIQGLRVGIEKGSISVDFPEKLRSGMQRGSFVLFLDEKGKLADAPIGTATNEAMDRAKQATEESRCVWPEF